MNVEEKLVRTLEKPTSAMNIGMQVNSFRRYLVFLNNSIISGKVLGNKTSRRNKWLSFGKCFVNCKMEWPNHKVQIILEVKNIKNSGKNPFIKIIKKTVKRSCSVISY